MDFYQNDKNVAENSSGVHSDLEIDNNHNQLSGKLILDTCYISSSQE